MLQMFPVFMTLHAKISRQELDSNRGIYMYFLKFLTRENDVTPSNVMEKKTDVNKNQNDFMLVRTVICLRNRFSLPVNYR